MRALLSIIIVSMIIASPVSAGTEFQKEGENYNLLIAAHQWEFKVYDLNSLNMDPVEVLLHSNFDDLEFEAKYIRVDKGSTVSIALVSRDVMYGLAIEEFDFNLISERPEPGVEYSDPTYGSITFGQKDEMINTFGSIPTGLGHDEMYLTFIVGSGGIERFLQLYVLPLSIIAMSSLVVLWLVKNWKTLSTAKL